MSNANGVWKFKHNGEDIELPADTLAAIDHDTHFNPDSPGRAALIDAAVKAHKATPQG